MKLTPRKEKSFTVFVVTSGLILALYTVEAIFTFASPSWADRLGSTLRRGPTVVEETTRIRESGVNAYPFLQSDFFTTQSPGGLELGDGSVVPPLGGIGNELTILCNESGTTIGYRSDSFGFRNPRGEWSSTIEVALVGDSFTHGFCRPDSETFSGLLSSRGIATLNAGATGAGPLTELGILREYVAAVRPPVVYWLFYEGNDLIDLTTERTTLTARYLDSAFRLDLRDRQHLVDAAMKDVADSLLSSWQPPGAAEKAIRFAKLLQLRTATGLAAPPKPEGFRDERRELELLERTLAVAQHDVRSWSGQLRLVYLPERRRFNRRTRPVVGENHDPLEVQKAVKAIASRLNVPIVDAAAVFAAGEDPTRFWDNRRFHYNAAGYRAVADAIASDMATRSVAAGDDTSKTMTRVSW